MRRGIGMPWLAVSCCIAACAPALIRMTQPPPAPPPPAIALAPWPRLPPAKPVACPAGAALCFDRAGAQALRARLRLLYGAARQCRCAMGEGASCAAP
jgi:hypothetical protein